MSSFYLLKSINYKSNAWLHVVDCVQQLFSKVLIMLIMFRPKKYSYQI